MLSNINRDYNGRILAQDGFSRVLRKRVAEVVHALSSLERMDSPVIPYLAAWEEDRKIIWYEYIGQRLCQMLQCQPEEASDTLRNNVIDRRVYRYSVNDEVEEEIIDRDALGGQRLGLREEVARSGCVEAVYKIASGDLVYWLKDQARIERFADDNICLSVGVLTDVTKEMEQKDLIEKIGYFDELTRLPKRLIMNRIFEINVGHYRRGMIQDFVFLMIDADHFKNVNDTHGHQAGDFVLASLAELMMANKRKEDEIGRYGGEEFYGFSLGGVEHGLSFAERLRQNIEGHVFSFEGVDIPVTVSIGLAAASDFSDSSHVDADSLIKLADKRLYFAKQQGRNRVVYDGR